MIEVKSRNHLTGEVHRRLVLITDIEQVIENPNGEVTLMFRQKRRKLFKTYHRQMRVMESYDEIKELLGFQTSRN